jgi:hypothetical protein
MFWQTVGSEKIIDRLKLPQVMLMESGALVPVLLRAHQYSDRNVDAHAQPSLTGVTPSISGETGEGNTGGTKSPRKVPERPSSEGK